MENKETSHHKMMIKDYKKRFYVALVFTIPILILSTTIQEWFNYDLVFYGKDYLLLGLATFIFFYGGWPFLKGLIKEIRNKSLGMMTLIAVAICVAYFYSAATVLGLEGNPFFWELATLIDIMLLGHWIEMRSILGASRALEELAELMPSTAHKIKDDNVIEVEIADLKKGDRVLVKPGEKIPSDGSILKGSSYIDESMITGESVPVERSEDDSVFGGSINGDGSLEIEVQSTGEDSYLSKVIELVKKAQASKSKTQRLADKAAFWLTIISLSVGTITLITWLLLSANVTFAIGRMATVMVITCPHALGLAIPLVVAVSTSISAKNGLLIRNRTSFENSRKVTTVIFDKTGTLTKGKFGVNKTTIFSEKYSEKEIFRYAGSLENQSEHPIARGIVEKTNELEIGLLEVSNFNAIKGKGVEGIIDGKEVKIASPNYLKQLGLKRPENIDKDPIDTIVFLIIENQLIASISLSDIIREESYGAIKELKKEGIKCIMLTGDNYSVAEKVAKELNLDDFYAEVLPDEKLEKIKELQEKGEFVAMTGDGINDAPALAQANVGIAIGSGTDIAAETADIILVESNPGDVSSLIKFGNKTYKKIVQNLIWATGYNVVAIPLAAGALYAFNIIISPAIGAILMSISTVIVAINAKLLKLK